MPVHPSGVMSASPTTAELMSLWATADADTLAWPVPRNWEKSVGTVSLTVTFALVPSPPTGVWTVTVEFGAFDVASDSPVVVTVLRARVDLIRRRQGAGVGRDLRLVVGLPQQSRADHEAQQGEHHEQHHQRQRECLPVLRRGTSPESRAMLSRRLVASHGA